jgi:hypothetical protein
MVNANWRAAHVSGFLFGRPLIPLDTWKKRGFKGDENEGQNEVDGWAGGMVL